MNKIKKLESGTSTYQLSRYIFRPHQKNEKAKTKNKK